MAREYDRDISMTSRSSGAATDNEPQNDWNEGDRKEYRRVMSAGTITGDRVRNSAGEDLGKLEEIMLDIPTGRVAYAVLSFGGVLGLGNKLFALPWEALTLNEQDHEFVLNIDKSQLENAPGFDKDNWPDMADHTWGSKVYQHYGYQPYWESPTQKSGSGRTRRSGGGGAL